LWFSLRDRVCFERRGEREGGGPGGKRGKGRGYGQNALLLPPLPPDPGQRRSWWPRPAVGAGALGVGSGRSKEGKRRGSRGDLNPVLTLDQNRLWRQLRGVGRRPTMVVGGGGAWRLGRQGRSAGRCEARWRAAPALL
jgi:hypothetical protein